MKIKQASLLHDALLVKNTHGKGLFRQAVEILRARHQNPTLGATDYYDYRLYDPVFIRSSVLEDFLGWRVQEELAHALNMRTQVLPAKDKASFAVIANGYDLPVPTLRALYRPGMPPIRKIAESGLSAPGRLADWLRTQSQWPLFAKPSYSQKGLGCYHLAGYEPTADKVFTRSGEAWTVDQFVSTVVERASGPYFRREMGYLFQEVLHPHPCIAELTGNEAISGVRVVVVQDENGPEVLTAVWKIVIGNNNTDNWRRGTEGNLVAAIDLRSGRLQGVVEGIWPRGRLLATHPNTGRSFEEFVLPDFAQILALCMRAATIFPLMRIQYWDIAPTDRGPVILELNDTGGIGSLQLHGRGILNDKLRALLRKHGQIRTFSWIGKRNG